MCQRLQLGEGVGVVGIDHDFPAAIVRSQGVVRRRPGRSSGRKRQGARAVCTVVEGQRAGHAVQTSRLINCCIGNAQLHVGVTRVDDVDRHLPGHAVAICVRHGVVESFGHVAIGIVYRGRGCVDQMTRTIDHQGAALVARSKRQTTGTVCSIVDAQYSHRRTQILGRAFGDIVYKIVGDGYVVFHLNTQRHFYRVTITVNSGNTEIRQRQHITSIGCGVGSTARMGHHRMQREGVRAVRTHQQVPGIACLRDGNIAGLIRTVFLTTNRDLGHAAVTVSPPVHIVHNGAAYNSIAMRQGGFVQTEGIHQTRRLRYLTVLNHKYPVAIGRGVRIAGYGQVPHVGPAPRLRQFIKVRAVTSGPACPSFPHTRGRAKRPVYAFVAELKAKIRVACIENTQLEGVRSIIQPVATHIVPSDGDDLVGGIKIPVYAVGAGGISTG